MLDVDVPRIAPGARWYLVHSQPKRESKADVHLRAQGFRTFVPRFVKTIRHARQLRRIQARIFPGYLFVNLDLQCHRWFSIRSTVGVCRLISHRDGCPVAVPTGIVEQLPGRSDGKLTRLDLDLVKGQGVRVLSGPFAEFMGKLVRLDALGRVQVLLDLMGTAVPVSLHRSALAPAA
jgi:transcription elongation factor/antiterminator RfaH